MAQSTLVHARFVFQYVDTFIAYVIHEQGLAMAYTTSRLKNVHCTSSHWYIALIWH